MMTNYTAIDRTHSNIYRRLKWDETSVGKSTCGMGTSCTTFPHVPDGKYVAHMCATPGTLSMTDASPEPMCTATGATECVDVPFTVPSVMPVVGRLP